MFLHRGMIEAAQHRRRSGRRHGARVEPRDSPPRHGAGDERPEVSDRRGRRRRCSGAIVGGRTGSVIAQGSQVGLGVVLPEVRPRVRARGRPARRADHGARGLRPARRWPNMFQTIEQQNRSAAPEWLSDHPNPGNRYEAIMREAETLRVEGSAPQGEIADVHARLARMSPAPTSQQVARAQQQGRQPAPVGTSGRTARVERPSAEWQTVAARRVRPPARARELAADEQRRRDGDLRAARRLRPDRGRPVGVHAWTRAGGDADRRRIAAAEHRAVGAALRPHQSRSPAPGRLLAHDDRWTAGTDGDVEQRLGTDGRARGDQRARPCS